MRSSIRESVQPPPGYPQLPPQEETWSGAVDQTAEVQADFALRLEQELCFNLYAAANAMALRYKRHLAKISLTFPQYLVLLALRGGEPRLCTGELAATLRLDPGTLSSILKRLATAGLISRDRDKSDKRIIYNELTPTGLALGNDMIKAQASVRRCVALADDEITSLRETLGYVTEMLVAS